MQRLVAFFFFVVSVLSVTGQPRERVRKSTDVLCLLPAAAGATAALLQKDYKGLGQLGLAEGSALAANYLLEACIKKERPDHSGHHAFPSTHTVVAFSAATYITRRYGWKWGLPAYAVSSYVAFGRVQCKKHDVWDVLAGAALGVGSGLLFARPQKKGVKLSLLPTATPQGSMLTFSAVF